MKIVSHNINGLNAYIKNGKLKRILEENADVYCFQEVKCSSVEKIKELLGDVLDEYCVYNNINEKKKGYAGVTTLVRKNIDNQIITEDCDPLGINIGLNEYGYGRAVLLEFKKFFLFNVYSVNSGNKEKERLLYERNLNFYVKCLQKQKPVVICGDLNVCATELDYWGNYEKAKDSMPGLMKFEIEKFDELINEHKLYDTYRLKNGHKREYSWFSGMRRKTDKLSTHGWRLDYFLVSESLIDDIEDSQILEYWNTIDHSPITLIINDK